MDTPLDPSLAAIVDASRQRGAVPPFSGTPSQARERLRVAVMAMRQAAQPVPVACTHDRLARHAGTTVPVRIYRPEADAAPRPTVVFFHGGGFVLGGIECMDEIARKLCRDVGAVIVSVGYRLAPEHPFPAAHDDAIAATLWAMDQVMELGGDPARVAVAGESAGGNLAASTAIVLQRRGRALAAQLLVVPGVDLARDTEALQARRSDHPMLAPADLRDITRLYMGARMAEAGAFPPSPLRAGSLAGLPPAVIALAGHDPLFGEGNAYASRLAEAGVPVQRLCFGDMFHPFLGFFQVSQAARRANDSICQAFADCLGVKAPRLPPDRALHSFPRKP
ncbi:MAG: alpha/beta hydrolase [Delftia acidovorans]|jgi:acetyl esterase|nr:alpha/beta hydrolase [Delftia acidovorans]